MGNFNQGGRGGFGGGNRGGFGGRDGGRSQGGFRGGSRGGGRGGFGGDREVSMHQATCDQCKKSCEVPFLPTNTKPVYCKECFDLRGGKSASESNRGGGNFGRRDDRGGRPSFAPSNSGGEMKSQLESISAKLDKLIKILEKPVTTQTVVESKPVEKVKTAKAEVATKEKKVSKKKPSKK